jgi:solute carrier family 41
MELLIFSFAADDNDKLSVLPASTSGSLSSITTTSVASSEPDPGVDGNGENDGDDNKSVKKGITTEKWWQTTLQVSIPFLIAGIGTIGAGIILGRVEVRTFF